MRVDRSDSGATGALDPSPEADSKVASKEVGDRLAVAGIARALPGQTSVSIQGPKLQGAFGTSVELHNGRFANSSSLDAIAQGAQVLKAGARGAEVTTVQTALLDMGFSTKQIDAQGQTVPGVSGTFDANTVVAVKNFQRHAAHFFSGIQPTGTLDAATMRALDALAPASGQKAWSPGETPRLPNSFWGGDRSKPLSVIVVKDEHRTYLFDKEGKIAGIFTDSVGKAQSQTHDGLKVITRKENHAEAEADGRRLWGDAHAFGVRKIDLQFADGRISGEQLHGVSLIEARTQMGQDVSHGCARHYNDDIVTLFNAIHVGDRVAIVETLDDPHLSAPQVS